jgi:hypothetical protein
MAVGRTPGDGNSVWNAFRHLAGGYLDPATGNPYANLVESAGGFGGVDADGNFELPDEVVYFDPWININQDTGTGATTQTGSFQAPDYPDNPVPGIPGMPVPPAAEGSTDYIVMESYTYLNFDQAPKLYRIGVNSDDGFHVSWGPETRSAIFEAPTGAASVSDNAAMHSGGKGVSDIVFDVVVPAGGAGQPLPADVVSAAPWPGQAAVNPQDTQVQIIIADGATETVDVNSITLRVNGSEQPVTTTRVGDKVRVATSLEGLLPGGAFRCRSRSSTRLVAKPERPLTPSPRSTILPCHPRSARPLAPGPHEECAGEPINSTSPEAIPSPWPRNNSPVISGRVSTTRRAKAPTGSSRLTLSISSRMPWPQAISRHLPRRRRTCRTP